MKIGVDARNLVTSKTGIGRYVFEASRHLALLGHEVILYLPQPAHASYEDLSWARLSIADAVGTARRMIWGQTGLPRAAAGDAVDVLWGPAHRLPQRIAPGIARVVTIHDLVWHHAPTSMRWRGWLSDRLLMPRAVGVADRIVVDSIATKDSLQAVFPKTVGRVDVVYPGLSQVGDPDAVIDLGRFGITGSYILFVGTLEPRKNLPRLLEAYAILPEATKAALPLVLAGGRGWGPGLDRHIVRLGLADFIRITGYVSENELGALYRNAKFLAMPSLYEGFGFPIIEANAAGVPVLTSNASSMPEVAGGAALLVDPHDVPSIASGLDRLATDAEKHARLGEIAVANANRFRWEHTASSLEQAFTTARGIR